MICVRVPGNIERRTAPSPPCRLAIILLFRAYDKTKSISLGGGEIVMKKIRFISLLFAVHHHKYIAKDGVVVVIVNSSAGF